MRKSKLKIIFLFLAALILSGCAKDADLTKRQNIAMEISSPVWSSDVQNRKPVKIIFLGDMMFDRYIRTAVGIYGRGNYNYILEPVKERLAGYDLVVGNLEGPIMDKVSTSVGTAMDEKRNLIFTFDPAVAKMLFENNIKLVNLGNNHILNQGEDGLAQTKKFLGEAGVQYFGDENFSIREIGGVRIGFVSYNYSTENSFEKAIGEIREIESRTDFIIACPHWGVEYKTGDPGGQIRDMARRFIDAGADAVIGTHSHVVQSSEEHNGKKIYYSLGNFVFDQYFQKETTEGLGVELIINPDRTLEYGEVEFEMTKRGQTELAD